MEPTIQVVAVETPAQLEDAYNIRRRVFIEEQKVPEEIEMDDDDARAFHALALLNGLPAGCGRFVAHDGSEVKIGRMAVLQELRGKDVGRAILRFLMKEAQLRGFRHAVLHAQLTAEGFYLKEGFLPIGDQFEEAGIPHRKMERAL